MEVGALGRGYARRATGRQNEKNIVTAALESAVADVAGDAAERLRDHGRGDRPPAEFALMNN
jgi:hypothetical protein